MLVECISTFDRLSSLRPEWDALYQRSPAAAPFQHPEWLLPWWRHFGSGEMFTFAIRMHDRLIGLAPLFLHPWNGRRQVTFLGNGVSDRLGFLLEPEHAESAAAAILDAIHDQRSRWDLCDLQDLDFESPLCCLAAPVACAARPQHPCMSIALPRAPEEFYDGLPHGIRRNLRRYREHLQGLGTVEYGTAPGGAVFFSEALDALICLHRARWESKNDPGMICGDSMERFHREAAAALAGRGIVRLHTVRLNGRIIAVVYAFLDRGRAYSYLGGFDPELSRYSPGALALEYAIAQSIREGAREYDFLRGDEKYKTDWGARKRTSYRLLLWHDQAPVDLLDAA